MKSFQSSALSRIFTKKNANLIDTVNLTSFGILYLIASVLQLSWLVMVITHWNVALQWVSIPVIGWALAAIWVGMTWCIFHLFYIGIRMIQLSNNTDAIITQTPQERKKMLTIALLLGIGIVIDITVVPALVFVEDKSAVLFFTGLIGGRILQANMEGILQYHRM